jgi:hypothetical protein
VVVVDTAIYDAPVASFVAWTMSPPPTIRANRWQIADDGEVILVNGLIAPSRPDVPDTMASSRRCRPPNPMPPSRKCKLNETGNLASRARSATGWFGCARASHAGHKDNTAVASDARPILESVREHS